MKWVKASERMPVALKDRQRINIKYKGVADSIINISGRWYWNNDVPTEYLISQDSWLAIEWLDESTPPVSAMEDGFTDYRIYHNDKVNSILAAAIRFLNTEQLVVLKDCLIERTPKK